MASNSMTMSVARAKNVTADDVTHALIKVIIEDIQLLKKDGELSLNVYNYILS